MRPQHSKMHTNTRGGYSEDTQIRAPDIRRLRARICKGSRLLSVKAPSRQPPSWLPVAGRTPRRSAVSAAVCAGLGYVIAARAAGIPLARGGRSPGCVSGQAMDELARDLAARLGGPAVSER